MKAPCPICYAPMLTYSDYLDGHTLLESGEECEHGCFHHRYAYGNTEITVTIRGHHFMFTHCYLDGYEDTRLDWTAVEELFAPARAALIEDLRRYKRAVDNHLCEYDAADWLACSGHDVSVCDLCEWTDKNGDEMLHKHELLRLRKRVAELENNGQTDRSGS